jgi:hypothetical protein
MSGQTLVIDVPLTYGVVLTPKRHRSEKEFHVVELVPVAFAVFDDETAPVSVTFEGIHGLTASPDGGMLSMRSTESAHYRPAGVDDGVPSKLDAFCAYLGGGSHYASGGSHILERSKPFGELPEGKVSRDNRDERLADLRRKLSRYAVIAGTVHEVMPEPVFHIRHRERGQPFRADVVLPGHIQGQLRSDRTFGLLDAERARDQLRLMNNGDSAEIVGTVVIMRPDLLRYRHDEEPRMRSYITSFVSSMKLSLERSVDTAPLEWFQGYRNLKAVADGPIEEAVEALRGLATMMQETEAGRSLNSTSLQRLDDWDRFVASRSAVDDLSRAFGA